MGFENVERDGAVSEDDVVEFALVEFGAEFFFGEGAEFTNLELANFVGQRLTGPRDVAVDFDGDVLIGLPSVVFKELDGLIAAPAHRVHTRVYDKANGA